MSPKASAHRNGGRTESVLRVPAAPPLSVCVCFLARICLSQCLNYFLLMSKCAYSQVCMLRMVVNRN